MLKEIRCQSFNHGRIAFHDGLNIILGDDDAKNSIGKSTALMVIDFVFGGDTFLADGAGAIRVLGPHQYDFCLCFVGQTHFFCRSTDAPDVVYVCDKNYSKQSSISVEDYRHRLAGLYGLNQLENSFRSIVSPFVRIWRKGGLEPDQPFIGASKEPASTAVHRLIDLFGRSADIAVERELIDKQKERKKLIASSMNESIIPRIDKKKFEQNKRVILESAGQIEQLKQGFSGALNAYESLFDENLRGLQQRRNELVEFRADCLNKINRLRREIAGITPRLAANITLVAEFFPTVDVQRLEEVETFHQKIGSIVKKELKEQLALVQSEEATQTSEILSLEQQIQSSLKSKGMPDDLFKRVFELKETSDKAVEENKYFEQKAQLEAAVKISIQRLDDIYSQIFLEIERKINSKLRTFNKVVYGPSRSSSELRLKKANSYSFTSPQDTGTGKSYAGLIGFDLAMLSLTRLPFVIHDSVIYKNIEVPATKRILRILAAVKSKQIFLSFDEAKKFGSKTEHLLKKFTVLKLSHNDLLYTKDWRDKK